MKDFGRIHCVQIKKVQKILAAVNKFLALRRDLQSSGPIKMLLRKKQSNTRISIQNKQFGAIFDPLGRRKLNFYKMWPLDP